MQEKSNIFHTSKERILQYLDYKKISQYEFSKKTGLANGFLKAGDSVSSKNLELLSNIYSDLNILWVVTGKGNMILGNENIISNNNRDNNITLQNNNLGDNNKVSILLHDKEEEIEKLKREIEHLNSLLAAKDKIISLLERK